MAASRCQITEGTDIFGNIVSVFMEVATLDIMSIDVWVKNIMS